MSKKETTIRIGDTVIVKNKVVSYGLPENYKKTLIIQLVGGYRIENKYSTEEEARRNFDVFNKKMLEYLDHAN